MKTVARILLLSLVMLHPAFAAWSQDTSRTYPIPRAEMEDILTDWFIHSGFTLKSRSAQTEMLRIILQQGSETWDIELRHKSPLATDIHASYSFNGNPDQQHLQSLWNFLSGYRKGSSVHVQTSTADIPAAVLSHIESVVCIVAQVNGETVQFSGFIVDPSGVILSTAHNLKGLNSMSVTLFDGKTMPGRILRIDYEHDLALIDVEMEFNAHVSLIGGVKLLGMGQKIYSIGCPDNLGGTIYSGFINGPPRSVDNHPLWQANMKVYPGSSGSPVFNDNGTLVAVVKARHKGTDSLGFLLPYETVQAFIREIDQDPGNRPPPERGWKDTQ
ncbi:MAG TPA: serine protease [Deltaproteobacteria bacterium]|nr:serine protease [Deltaproteobacteria bacterium]